MEPHDRFIAEGDRISLAGQVFIKIQICLVDLGRYCVHVAVEGKIGKGEVQVGAFLRSHLRELVTLAELFECTGLILFYEKEAICRDQQGILFIDPAGGDLGFQSS